MASSINWNDFYKNTSDADSQQLELDLEDDMMSTTSNLGLSSILGPSTIDTTSITGQVYSISSGTGSTVWTNPTYNYINAPGTLTTTNASPYSNSWNISNTLKVEGDAQITGDLSIKGISLSNRLDEIESRLGILRPNNDLEGRWEELKELGNKYRELEKEILEKEQIWDMLKK